MFDILIELRPLVVALLVVALGSFLTHMLTELRESKKEKAELALKKKKSISRQTVFDFNWAALK